MPTLEIIQITNGETKVLRTVKRYPELYQNLAAKAPAFRHGDTAALKEY